MAKLDPLLNDGLLIYGQLKTQRNELKKVIGETFERHCTL